MAIRDLFLGGKSFQAASPLVGAAPSAPLQQKDLSELSVRLREYVVQSGLTQDEFARELALALKRPVSRSRLASWLNGNATPRISEGEIFEACEAVAKQSDGTPQLVKGVEAAAAIQRYLDAGLTRKNLRVAGKVPQSTFSQWEAGRGDVRARAWLEFVSHVDAYIDTMKKAGAL